MWLSGTWYTHIVRSFSLIHLRRLVWNRAIVLFSLIWRFISWLWAIVFIGVVIGILGNFAYTYLTTNKFNFNDPRTLTIVNWISTHLYQFIFTIILTSFFTLCSYLAYYTQSKASREIELSEYTLKRVSQLNPNNYRLFRYIKRVYFCRDGDILSQQILHKIAHPISDAEVEGPLGICIFGRPTQGKTRLAWEAIQTELSSWILVKWPHDREHPFDFVAQHGKRILLWLDDIHEFANSIEASTLNDLPRRFNEAQVRLVIVATCRNGENETQARQFLGILLERLSPIRLNDITKEDSKQLIEALKGEGMNVHDIEFDGTPGSLLLGTQRMRDQRYPQLPIYAQKILKAMKLLRSIGFYGSMSRVV